MRILLDTHVFVWMLADPGRIRADALEKLEDSSHEAYSQLLATGLRQGVSLFLAPP